MTMNRLRREGMCMLPSDKGHYVRFREVLPIKTRVEELQDAQVRAFGQIKSMEEEKANLIEDQAYHLMHIARLSGAVRDLIDAYESNLLALNMFDSFKPVIERAKRALLHKHPSREKKPERA